MKRAPHNSNFEGIIRLDEIELWLIDRDAQAPALADIERRSPLLPPGEREQAARKVDRTDAARWLNGRIALRLLLKPRIGARAARLPFGVMGGGRPLIADCDLDFSLSDRGSMLLVAFSRVGRIGVDIESARPLNISPVRIARLVAAANGLAGEHCRQLIDPDMVVAWTRIEAFAKATADSLAACLSMLGTAGHIGHPATLDELRRHAARTRYDAAVSVRDLDLPHGLVGALATPVAAANVNLRIQILDHHELSALAERTNG